MGNLGVCKLIIIFGISVSYYISLVAIIYLSG